jgi:hypothetical protein
MSGTLSIFFSTLGVSLCNSPNKEIHKYGPAFCMPLESRPSRAIPA